MTEPPRAVLSEAIQEAIDGRRIRAVVFLTFRFDPGFFEEEVLPVFFDIPASHSSTMRLLQLEDVLRSSGARIAVYYDPIGIMGDRSARLDVRRVPVRHRTGYFHPKNVLVLVEREPEEQDSEPELSLVVATMSANLTQDGWWRNLESCHIEEVREGEKCGFRDDLVSLARRLRQVAPPDTDQTAVEEIRRFLGRVKQRGKQAAGGSLHPRLYVGDQSVPDFLREACGSRLDELNLEVISPYFDESEDPKPLLDLVERFRPAEVRVLLPRADDGTALCSERLYRGIRRLARCGWGRLDSDLLRMGKAEGAASRRVHAKVYRFFGTRPRYEALFVGSVNLTRAAHGRGGNLETAFLVERDSTGEPGWWLTVDRKEPAAFLPMDEAEGTVNGTTLALAIRYHWDTTRGEAYWDYHERSPKLAVEAQGSLLFELDRLPSREWRRLDPDQVAALARILPGTSFVQARADGQEPVTILVQEEGLSHKPSLLMTLSAADILRSWALLTAEQRVVFIEERLRRHPEITRELGIELPPLPDPVETFFDRFAGIFHGFGCLATLVDDALKAGRESEAVHRLFGRKYDSLWALLDRVLSAESRDDDVTRYVTLLCARQLIDRVRRDWPEFVHRRRQDASELEQRLEGIGEVRDHLDLGPPQERVAFLDWFERWFLTKAEGEPSRR
jgi:hypothetical protein